MSENDTAVPTTHSSGPYGLGGMLWLFGVPLMLWGTVMLSLLPLTAWRLMPKQWASSKASFMEAGWSVAEYRQLLAEEFFMGVIWFFGIYAAEAFFRRSPHFRWTATLWLIAASIFAFLSYSRGSPISTENLSSSSLTWHATRTLTLSLPIAYLWLSRRARNTFSSATPPPRLTGPLRVFHNGPRDWGGGVWCVAGAIVLLMYMHATLAMTHRPYVFPPELTPKIAALLSAPVDQSIEPRGNAASALIIGSYRSEVGQVPYARMFLALHVAGLLLALWSIRLFLRRASTLRWIILASALCLISAHGLYWLMQDRIPVFCTYCGHYDAPRDHLAKSLSLCVAVTAILLLPAVRRRFRSTSGDLRLS
jgi:hypothetical protein